MYSPIKNNKTIRRLIPNKKYMGMNKKKDLALFFRKICEDKIPKGTTKNIILIISIRVLEKDNILFPSLIYDFIGFDKNIA